MKKSRRPAATHAAKPIPSVAVFVETGTSWGRRLVAGVLEYGKQNGPWHIFVEPHGPDEPVRIPPHWHGDGIIARIATHPAAERIAATGAAVVNVSSIRLEGVNFHRVMTEPAASARIAAEIFRTRGFRNFGYVGNPAKDYVREQFHAYARNVAGIGGDCAFFQATGDIHAMIDWLRSLPKPVAVFCWGPVIGREVIDACLMAGIAVPHDVAVLGGDFDDIFSEASHPAQSGIRTAAEQIGMTAAAVLARIMRGSPPAQREWPVEPLGVVEKPSTDTLAVDDARLARVMRFIFEHAREPVTVADILRKHPMARRSLERKFRQHFGCTIVDQIRRIRVNQARLMLAAGDEPISEIAEKCGFSSYNYMGRVFQAVTGMSPREYRAHSRARRL